MKRIIFLIIIALTFQVHLLRSQSLESRFNEIGFDSIRKFSIDNPQYGAAFELFYTQKINHEKPQNGNFRQRVIIRHIGFDKPTVLVTEGYAANYALRPTYNDELAEALDANLVVVEHRYFGESVPNPKDWKQLNLKNATADLHEISQSLKKIYPGAWISTGISKGGQTTIYYRYFYPNDVQASVPYVAPLNFSVADKRVYHFQDTVATAACREKLLAIQRDLLNRRAIFEPMFADSTAQRKLTFEMVGGIDKAFEYNVLEMGFAYWQWYPMTCEYLPEPGGDPKKIFDIFISSAGYDFFADQGILPFQPFFYQALTEMGFYSYNTTPFKDLLLHVKEPNFDHTLPEGIKAKYSKHLSKRTARYLRKKGNNMLYIYGGYDAWSSTAVQTGNKTNALKLVLPKGSHTTRLRHFDEATQTKALDSLKIWMNEKK